MLTGDQLRAARERAGWTQQQLANRVGVTLRSVGNWERSNVPTNQLNKVRDVLADYLPGDTPGRGVDLHEISDARLLAEIARRFDRGPKEQAHDEAPTSQARESRAQDEYRIAAHPMKGGQSQGRQIRDHLDQLGEESQETGDESWTDD